MQRRARYLILMVLVLVVIPLPLVIAAAAHPTPMDWRHVRFAKPGVRHELSGRDPGWNQGRRHGRTEMEFLAQYEPVHASATHFSQGYRQGRAIGQQVCAQGFHTSDPVRVGRQIRGRVTVIVC